MCTIWASKVQFMGLFGPKVRQNYGVWSLSKKVFTGFSSVLLHMLIASTFRCVENLGLRGPIVGPLWAPKQVKIPVCGDFLKFFPLVSHQSFLNQSIWTSFKGVLKIGLRGPNSRVTDHSSGFQSFSQIFPFGFTSFLFYMLIRGYLYVYFNDMPQSFHFWPSCSMVATFFVDNLFLPFSKIFNSAV